MHCPQLTSSPANAVLRVDLLRIVSLLMRYLSPCILYMRFRRRASSSISSSCYLTLRTAVAVAISDEAPRQRRANDIWSVAEIRDCRRTRLRDASFHRYKWNFQFDFSSDGRSQVCGCGAQTKSTRRSVRETTKLWRCLTDFLPKFYCCGWFNVFRQLLNNNLLNRYHLGPFPLVSRTHKNSTCVKKTGRFNLR